MSDVAAILLGMLAFGLLLRGGWWYLNWRSRHPRPLLHSAAGGSVQAGRKSGLPVIFRMSTAYRLILCILLLTPAVVIPVLLWDEWDGIDDLLSALIEAVMNPARLILTLVIYLLCPYTAWNIYWRRKDFIRFESGQVEYRSGFTSGKLVPLKITMFRARSWRFDLLDLFKGQLATSWFLDIMPVGEKGETGKDGHTILDLKAMNLGGSAKGIALAASEIYGDKFLVNNQLPSAG